MIYFMKDNENINKYEVSFDKEKLMELRDLVIKRCSRIKHVAFETTDIVYPKIKDVKENVRNYKEKNAGVIYTNSDYEPDKNVTRVEYDEYKYPYLVKLIDRLLNEDASVLDEIFNPNFEIEIKTIDEKIAKQKNKLKNATDEEKRKIKKKIKKLLEQAKLNINQESVNDYYVVLQSMIYFTSVETMSLEDCEKMAKFFNKENEKLTRKRK